MEIKQYANSDDIIIGFFENRYGGGYIFGVFDNIEVLQRLQFAATYEYEQCEFKMLAIHPGVLPFVECENLEDGPILLKKIIDEISYENVREHIALTRRLMDVFTFDIKSEEIVNMCEYENVKNEIDAFNKKWNF